MIRIFTQGAAWLAFAAVTFTAVDASAQLQDRRERRRELVQKALDALGGVIKSIDEPAAPPDALPPNDLPPTGLPPNGPPVGEPTLAVRPGDLADARSQVQKFAGDVDFLVRMLQQDNQRAPRDPRLMVQASSIRTAALTLAAAAARARDGQEVVDAYKTFHPQWVVFDESLAKAKDLGPTAAPVVARVRDAEQRLDALLLGSGGPPPEQGDSVDPAQLAAASAAFHANVQRLVEDVQIDLDGVQGADPLLRDAGQLVRAAQAVDQTAQGGRVADTASAWRQFEPQWQRLQPGFARMKSKHVERSLARADESIETLRAMLSGSAAPGPGKPLGAVTPTVLTQHQELTALLQKTSLQSLVEGPNAAQAAADAQAAYSASAALLASVRKPDPWQEVIEYFLLYEESFAPFAYQYRQLRTPNAEADLDRLSRHLESLRGLLRIPDEAVTPALLKDLNSLVEASVGLSQSLRIDLRSENRLLSELERPSLDFAAACRDFQNHSASAKTAASLRSRYPEVAQKWNNLASRLTNLDSRRHPQAVKAADRAASLLSQLEAGLGLTSATATGPSLGEPR